MRVDADVIVRVHIHDAQTDAADTEEDKGILERFRKDREGFTERFAAYFDSLAKDRFGEEIADGYFEVETEVEAFEIGETEAQGG